MGAVESGTGGLRRVEPGAIAIGVDSRQCSAELQSALSSHTRAVETMDASGMAILRIVEINP
jgi:hypothetical protein